MKIYYLLCFLDLRLSIFWARSYRLCKLCISYFPTKHILVLVLSSFQGQSKSRPEWGFLLFCRLSFRLILAIFLYKRVKNLLLNHSYLFQQTSTTDENMLEHANIYKSRNQYQRLYITSNEKIGFWNCFICIYQYIILIFKTTKSDLSDWI